MKMYVVDAFTDRVFAGNQAAVCVTGQWLREDIMRKITLENNFSETAFAVKENDRYRLRWFTPGGEINLCGHATLATAYVLFRFYEPSLREIRFSTLGGELVVVRSGDLLTMDFPAARLKQVPVTQQMAAALGGVRPMEAWRDDDLVMVLEDEEQVRAVVPDLAAMDKLFGVCQHITAHGRDYDCVTRSFAPHCGVAEDPVCGRGHCHVVPYWSRALGKKELRCWQASARGGELICCARGERVALSGQAALYSEAEIHF